MSSVPPPAPMQPSVTPSRPRNHRESHASGDSATGCHRQHRRTGVHHAGSAAGAGTWPCRLGVRRGGAIALPSCSPIPSVPNSDVALRLLSHRVRRLAATWSVGALDPVLAANRRSSCRGSSTSTLCSFPHERMENFGTPLVGLWVPPHQPGRDPQMAVFQNITSPQVFPLHVRGIVGWPSSEAPTSPFQRLGGSSTAKHRIRRVPLLLHRSRRRRHGKERDPRRNVLRASMIGTAASAILYVVVHRCGDGPVATHPNRNTAHASSTPSTASSPTACGPGSHRPSPSSRGSGPHGLDPDRTETSRPCPDDMFPRLRLDRQNGTAWFGILVGTPCRRAHALGATRRVRDYPSYLRSTSPWSPWPSYFMSAIAR